MQADITDMLRKAEPTLMTIFAPVFSISALVASTSKASSAWASSLPSVLSAFFSRTEARIASHFATVREATWMSPSTSLFCAHLCATTCATPPAPMMRTFFFMSARSLLRFGVGVWGEASRQAGRVVRIGELADEPHGAVELADRDRGHAHAVEPVLLDHGVAGRVLHRDAVAGFERLREAEGAEHIAGQARLAADHDLVVARVRLNLGALAIDQEVEHVRLDRGIDDGEVLAVIERVEHGHFERRAPGDRGLARLQIDLHPEAAGKPLQP